VRFFITSLRIEVRRGLLSWVTALFLVLLPVSVFAAGSLLSGEAPTGISGRVIVAYEYGDEIAARVAAVLPDSPGVTFNIMRSPDPDEFARLIITGEYECVYLLPRDLKERVLGGDFADAVEVLVSPRTVINAVTDRLVFSAIIEALAPEITASELAQITGIPAHELLPDIHEGFARYAYSHMFVTAEVSWAGSGAEQDGFTPLWAARIPHGIVALGMLALVFVSLPGYLGVKEKMRTVLRAGNLALYYITVYIAIALRILIVGAAALFVMPTLTNSDIARILPALTLYALICAAIAVLLAILLRPGSSPFVIGTFSLLCCLLLGGVLIDPSELGGIFQTVSRLLPTSYYIEAVMQALS